MALTRRQREVLDFIGDFIVSRRYSPSLEEIAEHFGLSSVATVHKHVSNLEKKGFIRRDWNRSRSIDVVEGDTNLLPAASGPPASAPRSVGHFGSSLPAGGASRVAEAGGASSALPGVIDFPGAVDAIEGGLVDGPAGAAMQSDDMVPLPLQGRVAAGLPLEAVTDDEHVSVPRGLVGRGRSFVLEVTGDSMIDEQIRDGDFVVVEERSSATDGEKVVALIDGEATLKTYYREPDGSIRLQPANDAFEPIIVRDGSFEIRGVVIGLMRKYLR